MGRLRRGWRWYFFIAPNVLTFLGFTLFSWIFLIYLSFHDWNLLGARQFAGLSNYERMVSDPILRRALVNTLQYAIMFVIPSAAVSLGLATLVNQKMRGMYLFRALYYLPVVTSIAVLAIIWKFILLPRPDGIANYLLQQLGVGPREWLLDIRLALPSITVMQIWSTMDTTWSSGWPDCRAFLRRCTRRHRSMEPAADRCSGSSPCPCSSRPPSSSP